MSCRLTGLSTFLLLLLLRAQSFHSTHARPLSSVSDFEPPEIDGSAVGDTCRIFSGPTMGPTPGPPTTTTTTTTTTTAAPPPPITRKHVPPKKPKTKDPGPPVRPRPAPAGPIANNHPDPAARLLHYLLTNSRGRAAGSLPGFNRFMSQPIGGLSSESNEVLAKLPKRTVVNRWNVGSFSSDSSDES